MRSSPILKESNFPLGETLGRRLKLPITIESDANAAAVAEHWFRKVGDHDDFIVVSIERSIDLGVMHEGQLFRGARGMSFDVGSLVVSAGASGPKEMGRADMFTPNNLIREALHDDPEYASALGQGRGMEYVLTQLDAGHANLEAAITRSGDVLGRVIANIVTLFAPPRVVLVGRALVLGNYLLSPLRQSLSEALPESLGDVSEIVIDDIDNSEWARGAAGMALHDLYGSPWSTTGPVPLRAG